MFKRRFCTLGLLCFFMMSQVFAASGDIIQEILSEEVIIIDFPESESQGEEDSVSEDVVIEENQEEENLETVIEDIKEDDTENEELQIEEIVEEEQDLVDQEEPGEVASDDMTVIELSEEGIDEDIGEIIEDNLEKIIEIPDFEVTFQNPSYITDKDVSKETYLCDSEKDSCKINIKIIGGDGGDIGSEFGCEIQYSHTFEDDESCNPTTLIITEDIEVNYRVYEKNKPDNYKEKNIDFLLAEEEHINTDIQPEVNNNYEDNDENSEIETILAEDNTGTGAIVENILNETIIDEESEEETREELLFPDIILDVQSGLSYSGSGNIYICMKEDCKINLDISETFTGSINKSDYECSWDFGGGIFSVDNTDKKCNPGYVNYGTGSYAVTVEILSKETQLEMQKKEFYIENLSTDGNQNIPEEEEEEEEESQTSTGNIIDNYEILGESENNGEIEIIEEFIFPEILLEIQSGLDYSGTGNIYTCTKEDCKINLDISDTFTGATNESDYECNWDFGGGTFTVDNTDNKCNPGYVNYSTGSYQAEIQIISGDSQEIIKEKIFHIQNMVQESEDIISQVDSETEQENIMENNLEGSDVESEIITVEISNGGGGGSSNTEDIISESEGENTGSGIIQENGSGSIDIDEIIIDISTEDSELILPNILLTVQSGLEYSGSGNTYICNNQDCKINLDISSSFTGRFTESDFLCEWGFGSGTFKTANTDTKCNPGYVEYELGEYEISVKIVDKNDLTHFIENIIIIENFEQEEENSTSNKTSANTETSSTIQTVNVSIDKEIETQSGLENGNTCESESCKINLVYNNSTYETCEWNFGGIDVKESYITTCNPGFIYYPAGEYTIKLYVTNNKIGSEHTKKLEIENTYIFIETSDLEASEENIIIEEEVIGKINFDIQLQGKETDYKKYIGNKIICFGVDTCNINLKTKQSTKYTYSWDYGNGEVSTKSNPTAVWYDAGSYVLVIKIEEDNDIIFTKKLYIEVIPKEIPEEQKIIAEEFITINEPDSFIGSISKINISELMINRDSSEIIENTSDIAIKIQNNIGQNVKNIFSNDGNLLWLQDQNEIPKLKLTRNISQQKKALKFYGVTLPNATVFIRFGDEIFELKSDNNGKYEIKLTEFIAGDFNIEYSVLDEKGHYFESKTSKKLVLESGYVTEVMDNIAALKIAKYKSSSKASSKSKTTNKSDNIKVTTSGLSDNLVNIDAISGGLNYLFLSILILLSFLGTTVLLSRYRLI